MLSSVDELIDALGGTSAAATALGVDKRVVSNWRSRRRIPAEYFLPFTEKLGEIDPALFGMKPAAEVRA